MKIVVIYDDTGRKSEVIEDIIGDKGFADVQPKETLRAYRVGWNWKDECGEVFYRIGTDKEGRCALACSYGKGKGEVGKYGTWGEVYDYCPVLDKMRLL